MKLSTRILIVSLVDVTVTDCVFYYHLKQHPTALTPLTLVALILITLLPLLATLALWEYQQKHKQK